MNNRVEQWSNDLRMLSSIATTQLHTAHAALTHGLTSKWTFLIRTIPSIGHLLQPLGDIMRFHFIPALTGRSSPNDLERDLLALPAQLGGIAVINPSNLSQTKYSASQKISQPDTSQILHQIPTYPPHIEEEQLAAKTSNKDIKHQQPTGLCFLLIAPTTPPACHVSCSGERCFHLAHLPPN